ncbi:MAG: biopolymer transporter ExbD [Sphingobium sp.]|uniref:Biopolymer transport protein ExbD n=1 Tax=Sphingobium xenophagum TaxID=121428 RepID=A0A249MQL5_SPHXE|nr:MULTISPECIES: biopolymer transporter ExbD [Sphingobium]MBU0657744.1 biopolymer transporter ExbD [Alphaproteobacteria bacterium]ASY43449.1 biopolymer transporter ExbD [Sphingobium xenophagum]MBA4753493.1 biopolymer transporter ExbD [Sphingobium sp.]MBG6117663.1 biopolymer transport protein ExbD [Sphingobium sp. JAI105]MBS88880.1 biopolymer transporter ExbD [Sphingobium sp.]|tara:strand:- start:2741 stop:3229 length:489 start_codon:yes stop_codon:yes gene_type:complete
MAMSVGPGGGDDKPLSDINTTPLVDVMLVLLIIFLIAVPVVVQTVELQLPKVAFEPTTTKPENVSLSVTTGSDGSCAVYWNLTKVDSSDLLNRAVAKLEADIKKAGGVENMTPEDMPEVHIRGDINTPYRCIGGTIYTMQRAGFPKVGFISEPEPGTTTTRL